MRSMSRKVTLLQQDYGAQQALTTRTLLAGSLTRVREYHAAMQDTIRCIVTMLTDDSASDVPGAESLFQELDRPDHGPEVGGSH